MNHSKIGELAICSGNFAMLETSFLGIGSANQLIGVKGLGDGATLITAFGDQLNAAIRSFHESGLEDAADQLKQILEHVTLGAMHPNTLSIEARHAREIVTHELKKREFLFVASDRQQYLDQTDLFGPEVGKNFKYAKDDIREAGNCLAAECSTAAVFHLMRVAEYGLRALAYDRRVTLPKRRPLELSTWEDLIRELEKAETAIQGYPKTLAREAQFEFYHSAMMEVRRFKNAFRNKVAHTRDSYDRDQALSVFNHVRAFMRILAERIADGKRTPVVWKGAKWTI